MLERSKFAFLVMTADDEQADGTLHARQNVIMKSAFAKADSDSSAQ
jgi:predicted nucleotide-binding protein